MTTFDSPYDQYRTRNGQPVTILETIDQPDKDHDPEVLPMYRVQFSDGEVIEAWPEELHDDQPTD